MDEFAAFWWITHNAYTFAFKDTLKPGHPAQRQPVAVRVVQAGLKRGAAKGETDNARRGAGRCVVTVESD